MRWLLGAVLISAACVHHTRHIYVPRTPEGGKCWRECKSIAATCENKPQRGDPFIAGLVSTSNEERCEDERKDCLLSCPGAVEESWVNGEAPTGKRKHEPDDPD